MPVNFSASGKASGGVVFAGYGITAPEYNYDDYAGIDVKGKFVVVFAHEPRNTIPKAFSKAKFTPITRSFTAKPPMPKRTAREA